MEHRARNHLLRWQRLYPQAFSFIAECHQDKGKPPLPDWPDWCFCPIAAGLTACLNCGLPAEHASTFTALAAWRYTQGIYRFDPTLYADLIETPVDGDIPADVLLSLPEWCVYVETPEGVEYAGIRVFGAFAFLEFDVANGGRRELRILLDVDTVSGSELIPCIVHLGGSVMDGVEAARQEIMRRAPLTTTLTDAIYAWVEPAKRILSLLLYLCSVNDISSKKRTAPPINPVPTKTKNGTKLFPADGPTEWDVGVRMGAALRAAYHREQVGQESEPTGRRVRPHVRRAHWHTFLSGPRLRDGEPIPSTERRRELRWVPPIPVNVDDIDSMPATIRPVR